MTTQFNLSQYDSSLTAEWATIGVTASPRIRNNWLLMGTAIRNWAIVAAQSVHDGKMNCDELKAAFAEWLPRRAASMVDYFSRPYTVEELEPIIAQQARLEYKNAMKRIEQWELFLAESRKLKAQQ